MEKDESIVVLMEAAMKEEEAITKFKNIIMAQHGTGQEPNNDRNIEELKSRENLKDEVAHQRPLSDQRDSSSMDQKSSGINRREKGTGLATKEGLTGSDYDGQLSE